MNNPQSTVDVLLSDTSSYTEKNRNRESLIQTDGKGESYSADEVEKLKDENDVREVEVEKKESNSVEGKKSEVLKKGAQIENKDEVEVKKSESNAVEGENGKVLKKGAQIESKDEVEVEKSGCNGLEDHKYCKKDCESGLTVESNAERIDKSTEQNGERKGEKEDESGSSSEDEGEKKKGQSNTKRGGKWFEFRGRG